jgi:hypothetical protein
MILTNWFDCAAVFGGLLGAAESCVRVSQRHEPYRFLMVSASGC